MPIQSCSDNGKPGYKWGDSGKCYTYTPGSESSKSEARKKALAQGIAIGDVDIERANEVTTGSMGSGIKNPQQGYPRRKKVKKEYGDTDYDFLNEFLLKEEVSSYEEFLDQMSLEENAEAIVLSILEKDEHVNMPPDDQEEEGHDEEMLDMLDPEERMFANALLAITQKYGKFNDDGDGVWVGYISAEENDNAEIGVKCENCALHESENVCRIIVSPIEPDGYCRLAVIPKGYVNENEDDEDEMEDDDMEKVTYGRPGANDPRKTPAKPSERRRGSRKNPKGSAQSGSSVTFSDAVTSSLKTKMENHNKKVDAGSKRATLAALKAVYRRGAGAFSTSHRPGMTRGQWAMARVNAYLYLLRNGRPSNPNYTTDNDLLPKGHPKSSK